ncbi:hypothetical protein WJX81_007387 [Elliptochloris bilobata]|uniref:1-phosphatidylinositol 4-kinase n=1 Tax=Elliptochloris bilobata TaxID=381761 RepID=A0AAW1RWN8_9CHLO
MGGEKGKTDLLLKFFDSQHFDSWVALTYLYKSTSSPGVTDYLCNRLYTLPEEQVEVYLSQLCQLIINRPHSPLERVLVDLCARSLRIAVKVYWLLLAISQDNPKSKHAAEMRDRCERAALEGFWDPPFRDPKLVPISPPRAPRWAVASPPLSPTSHIARQRLGSAGGARWGSPEPFVSPGRGVPDGSRPTSPDGSAQGSGGGTGGGSGGAEARSASVDRRRRLRAELGDSEGVTALLENSLRAVEGGGAACLHARESAELSPPSSPRLRQTTFGATLDFIEALCDASSGLTAFAPEDRQWALMRGLEEINKEIEAASRSGVACWFPMGTCNERIMRLAAREATLLNSREKAPFMLFVEVLSTEESDAAAAAAAATADAAAAGASAGSGPVAESAAANDPERQGSHAAAGPGPGSSPAAAVHSGAPRSLARSLEFPSPAAAPANGERDEGPRTPQSAFAAPLPPTLTLPPAAGARQVAPLEVDANAPGVSEAAAPGAPQAKGVAQAGGDPTRPPLAPGGHAGGGRRGSVSALAAAVGVLGRQEAAREGGGDGSAADVARGLQSAMEGLRGAGPLVSVRLEVVCDTPPAVAGTPPAAAASAASSPLAGAEDKGGLPARRVSTGWVASARSAVGSPPRTLERSTSAGVRGSGEPGGPAGGGGGASGTVASGARALSLLCHWGVCRTKGEAADHWRAPGEPHVRVVLQVHGGVDLRLAVRSVPSHRRVPSDEALLRMAAQHRAPLPPPRASVPPSNPPANLNGAPPRAPAKPLLPTALSAPAASPPRHPGSPPKAPPSEAGSADLAARRPLREVGVNASASASKACAAEGAGAPAVGGAMPTSAVAGRAGQAAAVGVVLGAAGAGDAEANQLDAERLAAEARAVYGERFGDGAARIQRESPHGRRPGWAVRPVIVKSGDDCRQELLAAQLIRAFADIFADSGLPLQLRPYEVLVTSNRTALIELVPDSLSIHQIKARSRPGTSLADHFFAKFGRGTPACQAAQRAFAESMAAYSLVCYLLQIKDRHNGNILLDDAGRIVHIDFGFMLSNSPGGVNFEAAPFKLTRELLEVLDSNPEGRASATFDYFKVLCIQGFLACRSQADRIMLLVEMMAASGCPCFKSGPRVVHALRKRFQLYLSEAQCVEVVLGLIAESLDNWRSRNYDYYQRVLNGVL